MTRQQAIEEAKALNTVTGAAQLKHDGVDVFVKAQPLGGLITLASFGMPLTEEMCDDWAKAFGAPDGVRWEHKSGVGRYSYLASLAWGVLTA